MATLLQDLRYALRVMRKNPGFTAAAVMTLALGIGINTAMFSILNQVLLRPLPFPAPEQLVQIWETNSARGALQGPVSPYNLVDWRSQSHTLDQIAAYDYTSFALTGRPVPERMGGVRVTANFFDAIKVSPFMGRAFLPQEDEPGKAGVVIVSYGTWKRRFASDPEIIGKAITLNGDPFTVIGVLPQGFSFPDTEIWTTPAFNLKNQSRSSHFLFAFGRMKPGITLQQAQTEITAIAQRLGQEYPQTNRTLGVRLVSLHEQIVGNVKPALLVLWGAVVLVLLIACANVAGLLLARTVSRQKEIAIRAALGGSRSRLMRQFLTESVLLALIGGGLGLLVTQWAGHFVVLLSSAHAVPRFRDIRIDGLMLAFTAGASVITGIVFGIVPAFSAVRSELNLSARESGWHSRKSRRFRLRRLLVSSELALALVLLVGAGLLTKTLWRLQHVDPGFNPAGVLTMRLAVPDGKYDPNQKILLYSKVIEHLSALPGIESVGITNDLPFAGSRTDSSFEIENHPVHSEDLHADYRTVSSGFFETMRIRLVKGRLFTDHDNQDAPGAAIINEAFVKNYLPDVDPLGLRLKSHDKIFEVVGVVANVKHNDLAGVNSPELYLPYSQVNLQAWTFIAVRSHLQLQSLIQPIRREITGIVPELPVNEVRTMEDRLSSSIAPESFSSLLLGIFAALAIILAMIGIYGVIAYTVAQRTHEIGIRMALGAPRSSVLRMVLWQGVGIAVLGLGQGIAAALLATRMLSSMLFGVNAKDPAVFLGVAISLFVAVVCASYIPARRATKVEPIVALRYE
jgi:putative ABC transport system permease protein